MNQEAAEKRALAIQKHEKKHRIQKPAVSDFPAKNSKRGGGIGNYRQDEKKTPDPTRERQGKRDTETRESGMGTIPERDRGGIKKLLCP